LPGLFVELIQWGCYKQGENFKRHNAKNYIARRGGGGKKKILEGEPTKIEKGVSRPRAEVQKARMRRSVTLFCKIDKGLGDLKTSKEKVRR